MDKAPLTRMTAETTYIRWFSFLMLKKLSEILQLSITQEVTKPYDEEILQESLIFPPAYLSHVGLTLLGSWKFIKISDINEFPSEISGISKQKTFWPTKLSTYALNQVNLPSFEILHQSLPLYKHTSMSSNSTGPPFLSSHNLCMSSLRLQDIKQRCYRPLLSLSS